MDYKLERSTSLLYLAFIILFALCMLFFIFRTVFSNHISNEFLEITDEQLEGYHIATSARRANFVSSEDTNLSMIIANTFAERAFLMLEGLDEFEREKVKQSISEKGSFLSDDVRGIKNDLINAKSYYIKSITNNPLSAKNHFKLGRFYSKLGLYEEAKSCFIKSENLDHRNAYHLFAVGDALVMIDEYKEGFRILRNAGELWDRMIEGSLRIAYRVEGNYNNLSRVIPDNEIGHFKLGIFLFGDGMLEEAVAEFEKALSLGPKNITTYRNLARAYLRLNRADEAIKLWQKGIEKNPQNADMYFGLASLYFRVGELNEAIEKLNIAIDIVKNEFDISPLIQYYKTLGLIYYKLERYEEAMKTAEDVINMDTRDSEAYYLMGRCFEAIESDSTKMLFAFKKAIEYSPGEFRYKKKLSDIYELYGLYDKAIEIWKVAGERKEFKERAEKQIFELQKRVRAQKY